MSSLLTTGFLNAAVASGLAVAALAVCRAWRNPFVNRGVWLAVLAKFVVPPLVLLPLIDVPAPPDDQPPLQELVQPSIEPQAQSAAVAATAITENALPARITSEQQIAASPEASTQPAATSAAPPRAIPASPASPPLSALLRPHVLAALATLWLTGAAAIFALVILRIARFHAATLRHRLAPHRWQRRARQLADQAGLAARPIVRLTAGRTPPLVWRLGRRATILLPAQLVAQLPAAEVDAILAHEITHLRRRDDRFRWFELAVVGLWWWCPFAWLARRRLHEAEERCCDADALRTFPAVAAHYGRALLATLDFIAPAPRLALGGTAFMDRGSLLRRFEMIANRRLPAPPTCRTRALLLAACAALLITTPIARSVETTTTPEAPAPQPDQPAMIQLPNGMLVEGRMATMKDGRVVVVMPSATAVEGKPSDDEPVPAAASHRDPANASPTPAQTSNDSASASAAETADESITAAGQGLSDHSVSAYLTDVGRMVKGRWRIDGKSTYFVPDDPTLGEFKLAPIFGANRKSSPTADAPTEALPPRDAVAPGDLEDYADEAAAPPIAAYKKIGEQFNATASLRISDGPVTINLPDGRVITGRLRSDGKTVLLVPEDPAVEPVAVGGFNFLIEPRFLPRRRTPAVPDKVPEPQLRDFDNSQVWDMPLKECLQLALTNKAGANTLVNADGPAFLRQRPAEKRLPAEDFRRLADNLVRDVEDAYWELYFAYRDVDARKAARDQALATWRRVKSLERAGSVGGEASTEAQSRSQYYLYRGEVEKALTNLFRVENRLRYLLGAASYDGRLIRPKDEPGTAEVKFEWDQILAEALAERAEILRARASVSAREVELKEARQKLTTARADGLERRRLFAAVSHHELLLQREQAVLEDTELEISHQLADAVRDVNLNFGVAKTNGNRRAAADDEVQAVTTLYEVGQVDADRLFASQSRQAEATSAYYRSLVDYTRAIMRLHYAKGSVLTRHGYQFAE